MRPRLALAVVVLLCAVVQARAAEAPSRCVECHLAVAGPPEVASHVAEWRSSAHAAHDVSCDRCHGGQPTMLEARWAHLGVRHSSAPASPVHRANLFRTCAPCHAAQAGSFATSLHSVLLDADDLRAPSCSTCHGGMTPHVPLAAALEARCAECHPAGSARGDYPRVARAAIEQIARIRATLAECSPLIAKVEDSAARRDLRTASDGAARATAGAVAAFHAFDLARLAAALDVATRATDSLSRELER